MKLSVDVIAQAQHRLNPAKDRELSLRGYKIEIIEAMGATQDFYTCIDLSNNDIIKLGNFPLLYRLETLIVADNRIARIAADFAESLPNLVSLVLTNNRLVNLKDLSPIFKAKKLERLVLLENPVASDPYMREFVVFNCPSLRYLDFKKINTAERAAATKFFTSQSGESVLSKIFSDTT